MIFCDSLNDYVLDIVFVQVQAGAMALAVVPHHGISVSVMSHQQFFS